MSHITPDSKPDDFYLHESWGGGAEIRKRSSQGPFIVAHINDRQDAIVLFQAMRDLLERRG
jgi:hypothetical protein